MGTQLGRCGKRDGGGPHLVPRRTLVLSKPAFGFISHCNNKATTLPTNLSQKYCPKYSHTGFSFSNSRTDCAQGKHCGWRKVPEPDQIIIPALVEQNHRMMQIAAL